MRPKAVRLLMWNVSLVMADRLLAVSNIILIIGAAAVLLGTIGTIMMSGVREQFSNERVSANEAATADARVRSAEAEQNAGNALMRAAALEKEAQKLKTVNLALEAEIQPRRLSGESTAKLSGALSKLQPLPIGIVSRLFDSEGADFADDLYAAFVNAHWSAVRQRDWTMANKGIAIGTLEGTTIPTQLGSGLIAALSVANVKATIATIARRDQNTTSAHFQPDTLYLLIGAKP